MGWGSCVGSLSSLYRRLSSYPSNTFTAYISLSPLVSIVSKLQICECGDKMKEGNNLKAVEPRIATATQEKYCPHDTRVQRYYLRMYEG